MKTVLTIAGSDSCGGAGIQADIKTLTANGVYAMSAITALTAQNTTGVFSVSEVSEQFLKAQIDAVFQDITPDAVKIGMVSSERLIKVIAECLRRYEAKNIVVDPVMISTSGSALLKKDALTALVEELFPIATLITPNIPEAEHLSRRNILCLKDMELAAEQISRRSNCAVLVKGGHSVEDATDVLFCKGEIVQFKGTRINNPNTHGTGCTLSSAIAANLAKGFSLETSIKRAKEYLSGALSSFLDLGKGAGPLNHMFCLENSFALDKNTDI